MGNRFLAACVVVLVPLVASASVTSITVTRDNQKKEAPQLSVTTERHPDKTLDTMYFTITVEKSGHFERLERVHLQVKDGDKLTLDVPLELTTKNGVVTGKFHMTPELAKRCTVRLFCPSPVRTSVVTFEVQLGTFLD